MPNLVVAPVIHVGEIRILDGDTLEATRRVLYSVARVVSVSAWDLPAICGEEVSDVEALKRAAGTLRSQGARAVLVTGAACRGQALDLLDDEGKIEIFDASPVPVPLPGGMYGARSAALAAHLARGDDLPRAVDAAQRYVGFRLMRGR